MKYESMTLTETLDKGLSVADLEEQGWQFSDAGNAWRRPRALVVNLFGAPCAGKSVMAADIFSDLKKAGYRAELSHEYAKEVHFDKRWEVMKDQIYLLAKQRRRIERLASQCEVIVTDCPLLLGGVYYPELFPDDFRSVVKWAFDQYENQNFILHRAHPYSNHGRRQTEAEADQIGANLSLFLNQNGYSSARCKSDEDGRKFILKEVLKVLQEREEEIASEK